MKVFHGMLLALHAGLLIWGALGLAEFLTPAALVIGLDNPLFPPPLQLAHWLAILSGALAYLGGSLLRSRRALPLLMLAYGFMAAVCAVETVFYMESPWRWLAMIAEYAAYLSILLFHGKFGLPPAARAGPRSARA